MTGLEKKLELRPEDADIELNYDKIGFETTDSLQPLDGIVGQDRALRALELGLGIRDKGYNIYVSGMSGMGKKEMVKKILKKRVNDEPTPPDWIYVNNFDQEDRPIAIELEAGKGLILRHEMSRLIQNLKDELPKAFRREDFSREKEKLNQEYENKGREAFDKLSKLANEKNLVVQQTPDGRILMVPKKDDRAMNNEEYEQLSETEKEEITQNQQAVREQASSVLSQQQEMGNKLRNNIRQIERDFATRIIFPRIEEIANQYKNETLRSWFDKMKEHMLENLSRFQDKSSQQQQMAAMMGMAVPKEESFTEYEVNVVVDNSSTDGAPVIVEESPNYKNLFGTIAGTFDRTGRMFTNFTNIKAGSLLRASGGYLVFNLIEALMEPLVWKELKRTIKSGELEYHMYDPFGVFATSALRPAAVPLRVKMVVVGNPLVYYLLQLYDEDFKEIFKVKADFSPELSREEGSPEVLGQFIQKIKETDSVIPFEVGAIGELTRIAARMAGDKKKITAEFSRIADIARESSFWAKKDNVTKVSAQHVRQAVDEKIYRSNLIASRIRELIREGTLLISLEGSVVGQINGLGVIQLGDYAFGKPSRLTSSVGIGAAGIINIERESKLSGRSFDKAMLILEGYLRNKYAGKHPLALSASIAMEQSYGMIEGDSASIAELVCLLSAFAGVPLRQDIAVTGSVNQWGQVQAIGGVNEKVEGFFDICKEIGLSGTQGVCIPSSNVKNLVVRNDIIDAMREGKFHIWAVSTINEAIELFSGLPAGNLDEQDTFHWRVNNRLIEMLDIVKEQKAVSTEREVSPYQVSPNGSKDPRPRLPGQD